MTPLNGQLPTPVGRPATASGASGLAGSSGQPARNATARQVWLRSMENAQVANWFKTGPAPTPAPPAARPFAPFGHAAPVMPPPADDGSGAQAWTDGQELGSASAQSDVHGGPAEPPTALRPAMVVSAPAADTLPRANPSLVDGPASLAGARSRVFSSPTDGAVEQTTPLPAAPPLAPARAAIPMPRQAELHAVPDTALPQPVETDASASTAWTPDTAAAGGLAHCTVADVLAGANGSFALRDPGTANITRVHAQWTPEGLHLWLGIDGNARQVNNQASQLAREVGQALAGRGQRLLRVVCNGQELAEPRLLAPAAPHARSALLPSSFPIRAGTTLAGNDSQELP